ncbi:MAG TPA: M20/M25/M40 family metallo-hydrolase [Terriglobales bacterium]|nr:M20/M25/M40 family metallo-hydrolase [Terriglobales bacterium]
MAQWKTWLVRSLLVLFLITLFAVSALRAQIDDPTRQLAHDIFKQLIEINTTDSVGSVTAASEAMAQRFRDARFPESDLHILGPNQRKKNLVVRLRGSGRNQPVLLIGHLDVVEARREDWTTDPFQFVEKDGYYYGRGTQDMKDGDAIMVATLIRMKEEGYTPDRDIILALTADEEGGNSNGVDWLVKNHRELVEAEFVLNSDGGGITTENGKPVMMEVDATEKLYADYQLTVTNPGGHSSLPVPDNAIYHLANGLVRLEDYEFPMELNSVTRAYYARMAEITTGQRSADMKAILKDPPDQAAIERLSKDPIDHSKLRTTCVATRLNAGHANNALPQTAQANVNCRIAPGHSAEDVRAKLIEIVADPQISVQYVGVIGGATERASSRQSYAPPPLRPDVFQPLDKIVNQLWPGLPVIPTMATGASDAIYTNTAGLPTYGISGTAIARDDVRAHGKDERLEVESFYTGVDFYYRFLKALTAGQ